MENPGGLQRQAVFPESWEKWKGGISVMEMNCFDFRIINMPDGSQVIDQTIKTPLNALTAVQMAEYTEIDTQLAYMEMLKRKARRELEQQRKNSQSLLYKAACLFGLV